MIRKRSVYMKTQNKLIIIILLTGFFISCGLGNKKEEFINNLISQMTLDEKVGQMTQIDKRMLDSDGDIAKYFIGSILSGGGSVPADNTPKGWVKMINSYQEQALSTRLKIPLIYGIDAVHGHSNVVGATIFPHNIGLGCANDPELIYDVNHVTAVEVAATGLHWTFSPCITIPRDDRWGRQYEGFSESPQLVSGLTVSAIKGYEDAIDKIGGRKIAACAKHFLGDGGTTWESGEHNEGGRVYKIDRGDTRLTEEEIRRIHLPPYLEAIKAGVKTVMISFNSWNGVQCHGNKFLINDLLKDELGFKGLVVTDWAGIDAIPGDYKSDVITSINAGIDMVMVPGSLYGNNHYKTFIQFLKEGVQEGSISVSRINDAVFRILSVKYDLGLFETPFAETKYTKLIGSDKHRKLARSAVRKSMVLLKNDNSVLPLKKNVGITVVGSGANNIGIQNGGWTVEWQGRMTPDFKILDQDNNGSIKRSEVLYYFKGIYDEKFDSGAADGFFKSMDTNSNGRVDKKEFDNHSNKSSFQPSGTTILDALQNQNKGFITYDPLANNISKGNTIVAVVGEHPYTEGYGDDPGIGLSSLDKEVLKKCYSSGNKVVVVILSGRPLMIENHIQSWHALIAAWLPGMAGEGVADVLFGDYNPTAKLSYTWPKNINQVPINIGDKNYDPLFQFGYGLSY